MAERPNAAALKVAQPVGLAEILALLVVPGIVSFAGGSPDPRTFPRERAAALLAEFAESGEALAFQYAPQ